jgi:hypothetical protein
MLWRCFGNGLCTVDVSSKESKSVLRAFQFVTAMFQGGQNSLLHFNFQF